MLLWRHFEKAVNIYDPMILSKGAILHNPQLFTWKALKAKLRVPWGRRNSVSGLQDQSKKSKNFNLPACLTNIQLASSYNHVSQLSEINLLITSTSILLPSSLSFLSAITSTKKCLMPFSVMNLYPPYLPTIAVKSNPLCYATPVLKSAHLTIWKVPQICTCNRLNSYISLPSQSVFISQWI